MILQDCLTHLSMTVYRHAQPCQVDVHLWSFKTVWLNSLWLFTDMHNHREMSVYDPSRLSDSIVHDCLQTCTIARKPALRIIRIWVGLVNKSGQVNIESYLLLLTRWFCCVAVCRYECQDGTVGQLLVSLFLLLGIGHWYCHRTAIRCAPVDFCHCWRHVHLCCPCGHGE